MLWILYSFSFRNCVVVISQSNLVVKNVVGSWNIGWATLGVGRWALLLSLSWERTREQQIFIIISNYSILSQQCVDTICREDSSNRGSVSITKVPLWHWCNPPNPCPQHCHNHLRNPVPTISPLLDSQCTPDATYHPNQGTNCRSTSCQCCGIRHNGPMSLPYFFRLSCSIEELDSDVSHANDFPQASLVWATSL